MHTNREFEAASGFASEGDLEAYARIVFDLESRFHESPAPDLARETIAMFPRYSNRVVTLPAPEQTKVRRIADRIIQSSPQRVLTVRLVGHADHDPSRERREPGFMQRISVARAQSVREALEALLRGKVAPGRITWTVTGMANRQLIVLNPATELARGRNRRVDVVVSSQPADPSIACTEAQDDQVDLAEAAAVHFIRAILKRQAVPQMIGCWEPRHSLPYTCDIKFSNNMVIQLEVGPARIHVIVSEADAEPKLLGKGCWLTYQCLRSGRFKFFPTECTV